MIHMFCAFFCAKKEIIKSKREVRGPTMRHIKKLMGMRNKETYARIYTGIYAHICAY